MTDTPPSAGNKWIRYTQLGRVAFAVAVLILVVLGFLMNRFPGWILNNGTPDKFFASLILLAVIASLISLIFGMATRGLLLLDCGPYPNRWWTILSAVGFAAAGLLVQDFSVINRIVLVVIGGNRLIYGLSRLQLRRCGVWHYSSLRPWQRYGSYEWADDSTLFLLGKGFPGTIEMTIHVPPECRDAIDAVMKINFPTVASPGDEKGEVLPRDGSL